MIRKSFPILVTLLSLTLGLAADSAAAYTVKLKKVQITSYSLNSAGSMAPEAGAYDLALEGDWPRAMRGSLVRRGRVVARDFPVVVKNCREGRERRPRGEFERPKRAEAKTTRLSATVEIDVPGERGPRICDLVADVPLTADTQPQEGRPNPGGPGQGGNAPAPTNVPAGLTTGEKPPEHDRPNPGGPGQGNFAPPSLPNLRVRSAKAVGGRGATDLGVVVVNTGAGAAAKTALRLIYIKDGVATAASVDVPALAGGQTTLVQVGTGEPLAAADSVTLRVDDPNKVSETNEADNGYIYSN